MEHLLEDRTRKRMDNIAQKGLGDIVGRRVLSFLRAVGFP